MNITYELFLFGNSLFIMPGHTCLCAVIQLRCTFVKAEGFRPNLMLK